jgi:3-deoxy-manno-octulosonate cytidylyltransferase (CMP-KDO synthetase)
MTRFAIVIPARFASTRFPGKPLAMLRGAHGTPRTLIERSWRAACGVEGAVGVWVATDDARIAEHVRGFGGQVVMTSSACRNGTERCAEALAGLPEVDILVNLQGDAPLTPAHLIPDLVCALGAAPHAAMATAALRTSATTYAHLAGDAAQGRVGGTTVVTAQDGRALYFSKRIIPYIPAEEAAPHEAVKLHLGLYAYRPEALRWYAAAPPSPLEALEGLEQLRFLEGPAPIHVITHEPVGWDCIELNNPQDTQAIESILAARGID